MVGPVLGGAQTGQATRPVGTGCAFGPMTGPPLRGRAALLNNIRCGKRIRGEGVCASRSNGRWSSGACANWTSHWSGRGCTKKAAHPHRPVDGQPARRSAQVGRSAVKPLLKGGKTMSLRWEKAKDYTDIIYEKAEGIARITINRPHVRNAFRPLTVMEMMDAFADARDDREVGVVLLTGAGDKAFCSGGDQKVRGDGGYVGDDQIPRLNVLDLQKQIRYLPKPVIAVVAGYAIGGGHVLHLVCDLTIAADNAIFGQTGPKVGSFDAGYGATLL